MSSISNLLTSCQNLQELSHLFISENEILFKMHKNPEKGYFISHQDSPGELSLNSLIERINNILKTSPISTKEQSAALRLSKTLITKVEALPAESQSLYSRFSQLISSSKIDCSVEQKEQLERLSQSIQSAVVVEDAPASLSPPIVQKVTQPKKSVVDIADLHSEKSKKCEQFRKEFTNKLIKPQDALTKRLEKLSDDEAPQSSDQRVYVASNEEGMQEIFKTLQAKEPVVDGCHIGFSGWYNLDIAAMRHSSRVILCDLNPNTVVFMRYTLGLITQSANREEFIKNMAQTVKPWGYHVFESTFSSELPDAASGSIQNEVRLYGTQPNSWLSNNLQFGKIKKLVSQGRIAVLHVNIEKTSIFSKMKELLDANNIVVDSLYISNIYDCLKDPSSMLASVDVLLNKETYLIASRTEYLQQHLVQGSKVREIGIQKWFHSFGLSGKGPLADRLAVLAKIYSSEASEQPAPPS